MVAADPAVYPYNLNNIYPLIVDQEFDSQSAFHQMLAPYVEWTDVSDDADLCQSTDAHPSVCCDFPQIFVHLQGYPFFNLCTSMVIFAIAPHLPSLLCLDPPVYPYFDTYPAIEPRNVIKEDVCLGATSRTPAYRVGDSCMCS